MKKISDIGTILVYTGCVFIGFLLGYYINLKKYSKTILEVLDNLKFTKKIDNEEYEYYITKFIKQKDSMKTVIDFTTKNIRRGKKENEQ